MGQRLGQHFLKSKGAIKKIIDAAKIGPQDVILEIGPGKGILTEGLLESSKKVIAVEKDPELVNFLRQKFSSEIKSSKLKLIEEDIRSFHPEEHGLKNYKLVANIPYYITGEILRSFLTSETQPSLMFLLVQKEVAHRIVANPKADGRANENLLSISVKVYGRPKYIGKVSKKLFTPAPKVDSAIILIDDISRKFFNDLNEEWFFEVVKKGFAQRRKKLINNLEPISDKETLLDIFERLEIPEKSRPEDVPVKKWSVLAKELKK